MFSKGELASDGLPLVCLTGSDIYAWSEEVSLNVLLCYIEQAQGQDNNILRHGQIIVMERASVVCDAR
jgi:hypothetical protein